MIRLLQMDGADNVAVTVRDLEKGTMVGLSEDSVFPVLEDVKKGYKIALMNIPEGGEVLKYGASIGRATAEIRQGESVHVHNLKTGLSGEKTYIYRPVKKDTGTFQNVPSYSLTGYRRFDGKVGIRNELWIIPTVGCVNGIARNLAASFSARYGHEDMDGVHAFTHPYGCSQLGDDHERTKELLQNMALHPNAGGVLVLGLGCENNQVKTFRETMPGKFDEKRIRFLEVQSVEDEEEEGLQLLKELYDQACTDERVPIDWKDLVVGLECGGSDAFSGITANPLIGRLSDYVISQGGSSVLTEVPEMFGAEHILMEQCRNEEVFSKTVNMINGFKEYYISHNLPVYENPSPGNKKGGITTLEDKSLGCTKKAGNSEIVDVLNITDRISNPGLNLLASPGNDIVATTALGTAGCQIVLFSTGRGNPLGGFIPTLKIASNSELASRKSHWIDFDAGVLTEENRGFDEVLPEFLALVASVVNGAEVKAEKSGLRDIALFKTGITL